MFSGINNAVSVKVKPLVETGDIKYIIPAGTAIQNLRENGNDETLGASTDGLHLNTLGKYTAGLTWFAKITGKSIDDITYTPSDAVTEKLTLIKQSVNNAIINPDSVTK